MKGNLLEPEDLVLLWGFGEAARKATLFDIGLKPLASRIRDGEIVQQSQLVQSQV